jgi:hypothetical protein
MMSVNEEKQEGVQIPQYEQLRYNMCKQQTTQYLGLKSDQPPNAPIQQYNVGNQNQGVINLVAAQNGLSNVQLEGFHHNRRV